MNQYKFIEEIQTILKMTNTVPFKVKSTKLYCAYCYLRGSHFEDADELRTHTFERHEKERIDAIEAMLRPVWMHEILRIDIQNLCCTVCETRIAGWNEMFQHLFDVHKKVFDQTYTRLIPYKLGQELHCALCKAHHSNLHYLDSHMNAHYNNHVCPECGDTFLTVGRIKKHMVIHNTGTFPCKYCGKVFTLKKYVDKHAAMVHEHAKAYKCFYCTERFVSSYLKHLHVQECHKDKVKTTNCELCGKIFYWKPHYLIHMRKTHRKMLKFQCVYCRKWFSVKYQLELHVLRHTGGGKHLCKVCNKNFVTGQELRNHEKVHNKEVKKTG